MGLCTSAEQGDYEIIHQYDGDKFLCYRHGEGTYHYSNGDRYKGQWKWNKMHGHGVYTHLSGDIKQGYFFEDKYIGQDPDDLFAATSCFSCFGSTPAEPLESGKHEDFRNQEQSDARKEKLDPIAQKREQRKKRREAMAKKYKKDR